MRQQFIITIILALILSIAICLKLIYFPEIDGHTAFYFHSIFWICGILITIISLNMLWNLTATAKGSRTPHKPYAFWPNRRETFRIIYPAFVQPKLIVEEIDGKAQRQLEFPIVDLSQGGSCFIDDGCLGKMKTFSGFIRFSNGEAIKIAGEIVKKNSDHVSVRFNQYIDWSILLKEQRRLLVHMRPKERQVS